MPAKRSLEFHKAIITIISTRVVEGAEEEIIHVEYKLISSFSPWQNKNVNNKKRNPIRELLPPFCNIHLFAVIVLTADSSLVCCPLSKRNESNQ